MTARRRGWAVAAAAAFLAVARLAAGAAEGPDAMEIAIGGLPLGAEVPADFLGLSFETEILAGGRFAPGRPVLARLFTNLGRGVLRFGGNSLDVSAWAPAGVFPGAASVVTPDDLRRMFAFAAQIGWTVLLGLDLGHFDPAAAAGEAAEAARLGGGTLAALHFGNEPDLYVRANSRRGIPALRSAPYGPGEFLSEWRTYLRAVRARGVTTPVVGPEVGGTRPGVELMRQFVAAAGTEIAFVTAHHYPTGAPVTNPASPAYASIANLLSPGLRARETAEIGGWVRIAALAGQSLRLDETNSAYGGGKPGVSDTLAGALWTADYLFRTARLGAAGVNLHGRLESCRGYTVICAGTLADLLSDRVGVRPNYYALLLFHLAARGRFVPARADVPPAADFAAGQHDINAGGPAGARVTAYAIRDGDGTLRIVVINPDPRDASVRLRLPAGFPDATGAGRATIVRLLGPALDATAGVTLGGAAVASDGSWQPGPPETAAVTAGIAEVRLPAGSAAAVTLGR